MLLSRAPGRLLHCSARSCFQLGTAPQQGTISLPSPHHWGFSPFILLLSLAFGGALLTFVSKRSHLPARPEANTKALIAQRRGRSPGSSDKNQHIREGEGKRQRERESAGGRASLFARRCRRGRREQPQRRGGDSLSEAIFIRHELFNTCLAHIHKL